MGEVSVRRGAVLLQRLGSLDPGEQDRWARAPRPRGLWAFPWPYWDDFFTYHQYTDRLPRRLRSAPGGGPADVRWFVHPDGRSAPEGATPDQLWDAGFAPDKRYHDERDRWLRTNAPKAVRRRRFWHAGTIWSHLTPAGTVLAQDQWQPMPATVFAEALRRCGGDRVLLRDGRSGRLLRFTGSVDHLEVFLEKVEPPVRR